MKKRVEELTVKENKKLNHDTHLLTFRSNLGFEEIIPGQFVNIHIAESPETFLRRPFSFFEVDQKNGVFSVLVKAVGNGTRKLVQILPGDSINIMYPLGKGFTRPDRNENVLLVGGGVGIAPMIQLAQEAQRAGANVHILLGARSASDHVLLDRFEQYGTLYLTTNDGSLGDKGFVTDHPVFDSDRFDRIYCCGPDPMMHAVARRAAQLSVECEVSLENTMACGYGVCLCCVTKTTDGHKCVCTDGPVFNTNDLQWQI